MGRDNFPRSLKIKMSRPGKTRLSWFELIFVIVLVNINICFLLLLFILFLRINRLRFDACQERHFFIFIFRRKFTDKENGIKNVFFDRLMRTID